MVEQRGAWHILEWLAGLRQVRRRIAVFGTAGWVRSGDVEHVTARLGKAGPVRTGSPGLGLVRCGGSRLASRLEV